MNPTTSHRESTAPAEVLIAVVTAAASCAPSVLNTQPWRRLVRPDRLELFAEACRHLRVMDPDGRLLMLSCGTVLHHVGVALAAHGWTARTVRTPSVATGGCPATTPNRHGLATIDDSAVLSVVTAARV